MKLKPKITLLDHFANLTDPRIDRTKEHKLIDILTIAICGMICGADNWVAAIWEIERGMVKTVFGITQWHSFP